MTRPLIQTIDRSNCENLRRILERNAVVLFIADNTNGRLAELNRAALKILRHHGVRAMVQKVTGQQYLEREIQRFSGWQYFPQLFVEGEFVGGTMVLDEYFASGEFAQMTGIPRAVIRPPGCFSDAKQDSAIWRISLGKRNNLVAGAGADGHLTFGCLGNGEDLFRRHCHNGWVNTVCFDALEKKIVSAGTDRTIRILDISTLAESVLHNAHKRWINDVSQIPNSSRVVSASADGTLALWDTERSLELARSAPGASPCWCVCSLRDGERIAAGDYFGRVSFFRTHDLRLDGSIQAHNNCVASIVPDWTDGVISAGHDGLVAWLGPDSIREVFVGHKVRVWSVATLPDARLAAGAADGRILIWRIGQRFPIGEIQTRDTPLSMVWWSGGNRLLVSSFRRSMSSIDISNASALRND